MQKRILGKSGLEVSALGLGCMGLSSAFGQKMVGQTFRSVMLIVDDIDSKPYLFFPEAE